MKKIYTIEELNEIRNDKYIAEIMNQLEADIYETNTILNEVLLNLKTSKNYDFKIKRRHI